MGGGGMDAGQDMVLFFVPCGVRGSSPGARDAVCSRLRPWCVTCRTMVREDTAAPSISSTKDAPRRPTPPFSRVTVAILWIHKRIARGDGPGKTPNGSAL